MDEILFRGKRKDGKGWITGYFVEHKAFSIVDCKCYILDEFTKTDNGLDYNNPIEVIPETVDLFIGHKDQTGKKIFIGDILDWNDECTILIKPKDGLGFYFDTLTRKDKNIIDFDIRFYRSEECAKIIGNKFDSPKLMIKR